MYKKKLRLPVPDLFKKNYNRKAEFVTQAGMYSPARSLQPEQSLFTSPGTWVKKAEARSTRGVCSRMPHLPGDVIAGSGRILCAEQEFQRREGEIEAGAAPRWGKSRMWQLEAHSVPRAGDRIRSKLVAPSWLRIQLCCRLFSFPATRGREFSVWAFLCVERICWDTLEAEVEAGAVDLVEHLLPRFIQHEETLLACKPTSVITADHCWEMNPYFCIVLT